MATSNEKQVQLKRETLLNDEAVLEEVFPKTMTDAVIDTNSGVKLSEVIDTILTAINNKVSRNVNSVNGRSGVVLLDASDVGLGNVDNVSTADIKAWIINYIADQFHGKRLILRTYYSDIQALIETNNDVYDGVPFVCEHATEETNDQTMVIGVMYKDGNSLTSQYLTFDFGAGTGVGRIEYDQNDNPLGEYFNMYGEQRNQARGLYSTAKGYRNITNAQASMVDGSLNTVDADSVNSFVTGRDNHAIHNDNGIMFGVGNNSSSSNSLIGGFSNQDYQGSNNIVSGTSNRLTSSNFRNIVSGYGNELEDVESSIIAGYENEITSHIPASVHHMTTNSICAGQYNTMDHSQDYVIAGYNNIVRESTSGIVVGDTNKIENSSYSIMSGYCNTTHNAHGSLVVGFQSVVSNIYSVAVGNTVEAKGHNSVIFGFSSNGNNPEQVGYDTRYAGVGTMSHRDMIIAHRSTPFSIAYGDNSFVAGKDNLGFGEDSFTIGKQNINDSMDSFVTGRYNTAAVAEGIVISGTQNVIVGKYSQGSGLRNCTSGHLATVFGAFNNAENYAMTTGIGSTVEYEWGNYNQYSSDYLKLRYYSNDYITSQSYMIRKANYIELPLPLMNIPVKAEEIKIKITHEGNVWSGNTLRESEIIGNNHPLFAWHEDSKTLRISREDLANRFGFQHYVEEGATSEDLELVDLRNAEFIVNITIAPNFADRKLTSAFKVGNGPFAESVYTDTNLRANAFEVRWDGTTITQKDSILRYRSNPNSEDPPVNISFSKLIDTLIANGTITLNDIAIISNNT